MTIWPWSRIRQLEYEIETSQMRLAACSVAAKGQFRGCRKEWHSEALEDVLELRKRFEEQRSDQ